MDKILCFRATRKLHESGFRIIEYGYMLTDGIDEQVEIVGRYDILTTPFDVPLPCSFDVTKSGWFRILPSRNMELKWGYGGAISAKTPKEV
jgi:hypothetical protein